LLVLLGVELVCSCLSGDLPEVGRRKCKSKGFWVGSLWVGVSLGGGGVDGEGKKADEEV
jgi:hypothetical protein